MENHKVAVFIDFDNIRIGIRQHFGAEIAPRKLMDKAARYGSVLEAKAYADFTEYARDFRDRLLFAAGIQPVHAPVKTSGGRRQSSADLHMVMDMFTLALDRPDIDTVVLMTGDGDFMRMVALMRHRFGKRVVVAGVEGTSTNTELVQSADVVDSITLADTEPAGNSLSGPARPRDQGHGDRSEAPATSTPTAAPAANRPRKLGSLLGGLLGGRRDGEADPAPPPSTVPNPTAISGNENPSRGGRGRRRPAGNTPAPTAVPAAPTRSAPDHEEPEAPRRPAGRGRGGAAPRSAASATGSGNATPVVRPAKPAPPRRPLTPELRNTLVGVISDIPPGRGGYITWKVLEETLRARAAESGWTRKEASGLLESLTEEGIVARMTRMRGQNEQQIGELVRENPQVEEILRNRPEPVATTP